MDEYAVAALCAVPPDLQGGDAEKFFDLIVEMYRDGGGPSSLDDLIPQIAERESGLASPAAQFSENLRSQGLDQRWPDIAGTLAGEGGSGSALASLRDQYAAQAGQAGAAQAAGETPTWEGFRAQNADFWSGWTGSDWAAWRAAFAGRVPAELAAEVDPHLAYLDGLDPAGQLSYLRDSLGFAVNQEALDYYQADQAAGAGADAATEPQTTPEATAEQVAAEQVAPEQVAAEQAAAEQVAAEQAAAEQVAAEQAAAAGEMAAEDAAMTQAVEDAEQAVGTLLAASADVLSQTDATLVTHDVAAQAIDQVPGAESLSPEEIAEVMREVSEAIPG